MSAAEQEMAALNEEVRTCTRCALSRTRTEAVPGEGPLAAELLFVGEAPGYHEDQQGRPFVGPSGRFLEELLASIGLQRDQVFITSRVKCRPPNNRDPEPDELAACAPYLERQLALLNPRMIVTLGRYALARWSPGASIMRMHGQPLREGTRLIFPMLHPAAALHRPEHRAVIREDMLKIPALLEQMRAASAPAAAPDEEADDEENPHQLSMF